MATVCSALGKPNIPTVQGNIYLCFNLHMGKMLEDGKNVQSLAVIVLDVFAYNFKGGMMSTNCFFQ